MEKPSQSQSVICTEQAIQKRALRNAALWRTCPARRRSCSARKEDKDTAKGTSAMLKLHACSLLGHAALKPTSVLFKSVSRYSHTARQRAAAVDLCLHSPPPREQAARVPGAAAPTLPLHSRRMRFAG